MAINVPCCPDLEEVDCCDRLDFKYVLTHFATVDTAAGVPAGRAVPVDVTIHVRIERCNGPLTLGDLAYTTTLLPGETVRLFSTDRRSRFAFDSETKLSYRHAQASEDQFFMASVARDMSDLTIAEAGSSSSHSWGDWSAEMDTYYYTAILAGGAGGTIEGDYDDQSTREFMRSLKSHAESSHYRAEMATRTSSSVSIGEVSSRTHNEGESEDHFESASRVFSNPNHCHAVSFFFYRINREQTVKFTLVAIDRQVRDPAAPTRVASRPLLPPTGVSVTPTSVLGSAEDRLTVERRGYQSVSYRTALAGAAGPPSYASTASGATSSPLGRHFVEPLSAPARRQALQQVDGALVRAGLVAAGGELSADAANEMSFERHFCLPTPGVLVRGCLDDCDICEPEVKEAIALDLERKQLENELLKKQIELLESSQEYRCCPVGSAEEPLQ